MCYTIIKNVNMKSFVGFRIVGGIGNKISSVWVDKELQFHKWIDAENIKGGHHAYKKDFRGFALFKTKEDAISYFRNKSSCYGTIVKATIKDNMREAVSKTDNCLRLDVLIGDKIYIHGRVKP